MLVTTEFNEGVTERLSINILTVDSGHVLSWVYDMECNVSCDEVISIDEANQKVLFTNTVLKSVEDPQNFANSTLVLN